MNDRQIMERNLALILQQEATSPHRIHQRQLQPANPFQKRVFERKFRKSTIFSENVDPNMISRRQQHEDYSHYLQQIAQIIAPARQLLDKIQHSATQKIKMSMSSTNNLNAQLILYNLKNSIKMLEEDCNKYMNAQNYQSKQRNNSQYEKDQPAQQYQPYTYSTEKFKPSQYFKNHQSSLNLINSRKSMESSQHNKDLGIKNSYYISQKNSAYNIPSQENSRVKMSIYQMVLEQRKKKQHKKKKMI